MDLLATLSTAQTVTAGTGGTVQFNTPTVSPTLGSFNTGSYTYTVGVAGSYQIVVTLDSSTNAAPNPSLVVNGVAAEGGVGLNSANLPGYPGRGTLAVVKKLAAGDTVTVQGHNANTTNPLTIQPAVSSFAVINIGGIGATEPPAQPVSPARPDPRATKESRAFKASPEPPAQPVRRVQPERQGRLALPAQRASPGQPA